MARLRKLFAGMTSLIILLDFYYMVNNTRLSAVFGGVFALNQDRIQGFTLENNIVKELVVGEQKIRAGHFVINAELAPSHFVANCQATEYISRAVLVTNSSIMPSEQEHLTLMTYPPEGGKNITTILEMGSLTGTCPKGYCKFFTNKFSTLHTFSVCSFSAFNR